MRRAPTPRIAARSLLRRCRRGCWMTPRPFSGFSRRRRACTSSGHSQRRSRATVSHHVGKLRLGGIVRAQRVGRRPIYVVQDTRAVELVRLAIEGRLGEWGPDRPVRHA